MLHTCDNIPYQPVVLISIPLKEIHLESAGTNLHYFDISPHLRVPNDTWAFILSLSAPWFFGPTDNRTMAIQLIWEQISGHNLLCPDLIR